MSKFSTSHYKKSFNKNNFRKKINYYSDSIKINFRRKKIINCYSD